ncbi:fatty acyl-CoA hydrolase precursor, medium chain-like [Leptodactylus fuscus]|uniref:fatty acyl-CoA hydrolase precursor, medium chain-like n=1 Tax=Leptodactylus fuscus TaxID=238119 RepID=UPI003F4E5F4F
MRTWSWILILCCVTQGSLKAGTKSEYPSVVTKYGRLRGITLAVKTDRNVHAFYGVPYAKPPMGVLRFAAPEPPEAWSSVRESAEYSPMCLQSSTLLEKTYSFLGARAVAEIKLPSFSEDCLYLNVFTPAEREEGAKLPVMVFIHGGALLIGGAAFYDGSALSAYENVVLVVIQYRLGILGFLSTGDGQASGNYGFLDQVAALRWVQENIADFGGDPSSVTIFGESAGAVSVSALMASPMSKGLFHRGIAESGVTLIPGVVVNKTTDLHHFRDLMANISGCESASLVDCLKKKTTDEILSVMSHMTIPNLPVSVDGVFLTKAPEEIFSSKRIHNVSVIIGVNDQECGWLLPMLLNASNILEEMDKETVHSTLKNSPHLGITSYMIPLLLDEYFGDTDNPAELRNRFLDLCGDISLVIPSLRAARYHRDSGSPVFFYEFQHRPSVLKNQRPDFVKSDHGDELMFVFGGPFLRDGAFFSMGDTPDEERTLSKAVMKYWANFARNGDPNGPGLVHWPRFDFEESYLEINLQQQSAKNLRAQKAQFWAEILPEKIQKILKENKEHMEL